MEWRRRLHWISKSRYSCTAEKEQKKQTLLVKTDTKIILMKMALLVLSLFSHLHYHNSANAHLSPISLLNSRNHSSYNTNKHNTIILRKAKMDGAFLHPSVCALTNCLMYTPKKLQKAT